jgi:integrase
MSQISVTTKPSRCGKKTWYYLEWGKGVDQRRAAGVFTFVAPKSQTEKNHNKEAFGLIEVKKSQLTLEFQSIGTAYIPSHKFKHNFLDYYQDFVEANKRKGNRHLEGSLSKFRQFVGKKHVSPLDITENLCKLYKDYLNDSLTGKTPLDYFNAFKRVIKAATKGGYFRQNPVDDLHGKTNASKRLKDFLEPDELVAFVDNPAYNPEIKAAFIVSCYTGLRWCDIKGLSWSQIKQTRKGFILVTRIIQAKTGKPVELTLHPLALAILDEKRRAWKANGDTPKSLLQISPIITVGGLGEPTGRIFDLPTQDGANKSLGKWAKDVAKAHELEELAGKHITWHSARLTFSILLQDAGVDPATVALLLGHTTTKYVMDTYKRHRPKNQLAHISKLPQVQWRVA